MRDVDGMTVGWVDSSIRELMREPAWLQQFAAVLLTSIDSTRDLRQLPALAALAERVTECRFLGEGLVIPAAVVAEAAERFRLFTGFDELWCFPGEPVTPKPSEVTIVAPLNLNDDEPAAALRAWMTESGCGLGMGDGIGLNYAAVSRSTAEIIERAAAETPREV